MRRPHKKSPGARRIDGAFLTQAAQRFGIEPFCSIAPGQWTIADADAFVARAHATIMRLDQETRKIKAAASDGRRRFGPHRRALHGARGTIEKALADPCGFDSERLRAALDTLNDYTEHLRVHLFALNKLHRQRGRQRTTDTEEGRRATFMNEIERAAGLRK